MPKRHKPSDMQLMPLAEQQALAERLAMRKSVRSANDRLFELAVQWVTDEPLTRQEFFKRFNAAGHRGEYHMNPSVDLARRLKELQATLTELRKRLSDTPADFSIAVELSYVSRRIDLITNTLRTLPPGTVAEAIQLYEGVGEIIREYVYRETSHWPEEFPLPPYGRITGEENPALFQIQPHQPTLLEAPKGD